MEKTLWNVRLIKKLFQAEKKLRHRPNERSDKKRENSVFLIEFPNASKAFWECRNSSDVCVCVCECDLGWLWAKWLLTQNSYRFDMVRWWWHNFVLLFLGIFFLVFSSIHFFALTFLLLLLIQRCNAWVFLSIFLHRAIELMPIWWSSISSDFSFSRNIKLLSHIPFHTLIKYMYSNSQIRVSIECHSLSFLGQAKHNNK